MTPREVILLEALKVLYLETADYITINNLGAVHQNQTMQQARAALELYAPYPSCRRPAHCIDKGYCDRDIACFN